MRLTVFAVTVFVPSLIFMIISGGGAFLVVGLGIWLPAFIVLVYYEAFLDATITRPW